MSHQFNCNCEERKRSARDRDWLVIHRDGTSDPYYTVVCNQCKALGRTRASYVHVLRRGKLLDGQWVPMSKEELAYATGRQMRCVRRG